MERWGVVMPTSPKVRSIEQDEVVRSAEDQAWQEQAFILFPFKLSLGIIKRVKKVNHRLGEVFVIHIYDRRLVLRLYF